MQTISLPVDGDQMVVDCYDVPASEKPPVLLIHGWGGSGRYWRGTVERLGDRFGFLVPDLLGFGRSLPVRRGRDIFDQVDALELLLKYLDIARIHVVGHSTGGAIAMVLAARRPDL
ncbi:MAG TPA: alpha/beta hydrolase, partial [Roseiflexaceae bacterium]|nr:alpha/beta hydrolase [Roseiflexaceae bacterium]